VSMTVSVSGLTQASAYIGGFTKQLPFATAKALTKTAQDVRDDLKKRIVQDLQQPTPFTVRGITIETAKKTRLWSRVYVKDIQAQYLYYAVEGGKQNKMIQPANIRLNKYGNIPRRSLTKLLARPDVFYGTIKGVTGIWQRGRRRGQHRFSTQVKSFRGARKQTGFLFRNQGRNLRLLAVKDVNVRYKGRFDFYGHAIRKANRVWITNFDKALAAALATAR